MHVLFGDVLDSVDHMTKGQLKILCSHVRRREKSLDVESLAKFCVGDAVSFLDENHAMQYGLVEKVLQRNLRVRASTGIMYTIRPTACTKR